MHPSDEAAPACPVCGRPVGSAGSACPECGWTLWTPPRPGPVTARLREDFETRLDTARRVFDATAAALLSPGRGRYQALIRGGQPDTAEWNAACSAAEAAAAGSLDHEELLTALSVVLEELRPGADTMVADIGPAGITVTRAGLDRFGSPQMSRDKDTVAWTDLLPELATEGDTQRFELAGGIARLDRAWLDAGLQQAVSVIPDSAALVVICRPAGWQVLEHAARLMADRPGARLIRVTAEASEADQTGDLLDRLAAQAPLAKAYSLVVAVPDPATGRVEVQTRLLFPAGTRPGARTELEFRRVPGDHGDIALAVTAGNGGQELLSLSSVPGPTGAHYRLQAVLDAPGELRFTEPACVTLHHRAWPDIRAGIPARLDLVPSAVDLVCALDLSGDQDVVRRRRALVRELLETLGTEYPDGELRVGVLGCHDHVFGRGKERREVVRGTPLAPAAEALQSLTRLRSEDIHYPGAAPIEDLLHHASALLAGSRAQGRAARLLLIGDRRPHPRSLGSSRVHPCPLRRDWRQSLAQLTGPVGASFVGVADASLRRGPGAELWRSLGQAPLHELPTVTARELGEDLGVLGRSTQRVPIPLARMKRGT